LFMAWIIRSRQEDESLVEEQNVINIRCFYYVHFSQRTMNERYSTTAAATSITFII